MTIRPSMKIITAIYIFTLILVIAGAVAWTRLLPDQPVWPAALLLLLFLWPLKRHVRRQFTKLTVTSDRLRYETGLFSKSTRAMELGKVQDVRVDQSLGQRILGIGDLSIETAGDSSRLTMAGIDRPQEVADSILEAARQNAKGTSA